MESKKKIKVLLAAPRGFCAGVDRAIQIVEKSLEKYGAPVYVRHEIVHNKYVVEQLKAKGAVFVESLEEVPDDSHPVIFSAHGVPKSVPEAAQKRDLFYIDATCPLVSKVHREAEKHYKLGRHIILIGHVGHPEVVGTMGQLPAGAVELVETIEDIEALQVPDPENLAYCTQTTLSVDDTSEIVDALQKKFPSIVSPHREDICYATTNRQAAVKAISEESDAMIVIGAPNSSNSNRLVEVGQSHGCNKTMLVQRAKDLDWKWLEGVGVLGITAGASAPDILVDEVIDALKQRYDVLLQEVAIAKEDVVFNIPRTLREAS